MVAILSRGRRFKSMTFILILHPPFCIQYHLGKNMPLEDPTVLCMAIFTSLFQLFCVPITSGRWQTNNMAERIKLGLK